MIRDLGAYDSYEKKQKIDEGVAMDIFSRFFVKGQTQEVIASEFRVEYNAYLQKMQEEFNEAMGEEIEELAKEMPNIDPSVHGYDFGKMHTPEDVYSLTNHVIDSVLFDQNDHFAGIELVNPRD